MNICGCILYVVLVFPTLSMIKVSNNLEAYSKVH
jgi:hypothetical protein